MHLSVLTRDEASVVLEVGPDAGEFEWHEAYRLLMAVWHPDRFHGNPELHAAAEEKCKRITQAYAVIRTLPGERPVTTPAATAHTHAAAPTTAILRDLHRYRYAMLALVLLALFQWGASGSSRAKRANVRGNECSTRKDHRCAVAAYAEAVRLDPGESKYHFNLGLAYARMRHLDSASKQFAEAIRLDPSDIEASRYLSMTNSAIASRGLPNY